MYEQSQRDLRNKQQELQRTNAELDKTREMKDQLARENKKLGGDYRLSLFNRAHQNYFGACHEMIVMRFTLKELKLLFVKPIIPSLNLSTAGNLFIKSFHKIQNNLLVLTISLMIFLRRPKRR